MTSPVFEALLPSDRALLARLVSGSRELLREHLPANDVDLYLLRLGRHFHDLVSGLRAVYGDDPRFEDLVERTVRVMASFFRERPEDLRRRDLERLVEPDWFQQPAMVGYSCYVDRFGATLRGVENRIDYLEDLGVTYLHLMPLLRTRDGENDGGYAVTDFRAVDPSLGSMSDLAALARALHRREISLCIDLVLNHVAREHSWAERALAGDERYQRYFWLFEDRELPDAYEQHLVEIFPQFKRGNFTYEPRLSRWVWTTFNDFQWDLNWSNPELLLEFVETLLFLANRGVDVFRLDALAFIWKRLGTSCQNQPEVHALVQVLRAAARIVAPAVIFKAEAIVGESELVQYLGAGWHYGKVCDMAYHNCLMAHIWSTLASGDPRLMARALNRQPAKPAVTSWVTYLRCHDDIVWAIDDADADALGMSGPGHRRFLCDFYSGAFPGSYARGKVFRGDARADDRRISGTTASLAGLEIALGTGDEQLCQLSIERILLAMSVVIAADGIPLIYMGDELGLLNDYRYRKEVVRSTDNRWLHRPFMDWQRAERRDQPGTVEQRLFAGLRQLVRARKRTPHLHAATPARALENQHPHVFVLRRSHPLGDLVALFNFAAEAQPFNAKVLLEHSIEHPFDRITQRAVSVVDGQLQLPPYGRLWLTDHSTDVAPEPE